MLAVGCIAFIGFDSDADPVQVNDETVNVYFDGSGTWVGGEYEVFNVFEAVQAACGYGNLKLYVAAATGDDDWTETTPENGTYPNPDYGTITTVGYYTSASDITYATSFEIYGCNDGDSNWTDITPYALGWIRPFTDYKYQSELIYNDNPVNWASAFSNIAIRMNSTNLNLVETQSGLDLKDLTDPSTRTDCTYTFYIRDVDGHLQDYLPAGATFYGRTVSADANAVPLDMAGLKAGSTIKVYGYGSDAYLALHHALNGGVTAQEETYIHVVDEDEELDYYTNYSWMTHLFGVGTYKYEYGTGYMYDYWASYKEASSPADPGTAGEYTSFNLGYHTNIPGSYSHVFPWATYDCTGNTYVLQFERSYPPTS